MHSALSQLALFTRNDVSHGRFAFPAIELAAMVGLDRFRRPCAGANGLADGFFIQTAANANDHRSQLETQMRMSVKYFCD